jgi:sterol desaturase/sphingolipid hydroxylase (fatty acid hydroxylase superfamily)
MGTAVAIFAAITVGTFLGWVVHWTMHQKWAGRFNKAHMTHHVKMYPAKDLTSGKYRKAGSDDGVFVFVPIIALGVALLDTGLYFLGVSLTALLISGALSVAIGAAHDWIHEAFHTESPWLSKLEWFRNLRALHFHHHRKMKFNLGILVYVWDRLLRTYQKPTQ